MTSVWVDYLHGRVPKLDELLDRNELVVCGPILAELIAGTAPAHADALWLSVGSLPTISVDAAAWRQAGECAGMLRRTGQAVPLLDVVIAVAAVRGDAELWTYDRDFERVRTVLPELRLRAEVS